MKILVLTLAAALLAPTAYAQKVAAANVPGAAAATFKQQFPTVKTVQWEKEPIRKPASRWARLKYR
jgi:hypothetical protein